jgi:hypothetical protein
MEEKLTLLEKPYWFVSDIQKYYGMSKGQAEFVKNWVKESKGVPSFYEDKERQAVSADHVIEVLGGRNRLEEASLINELVSAKKQILEIGRIKEN